MANVSLITIGEELLKGRITNTNAAEIGRMCREHGFTVDQTIVIGDRPQQIHDSIETAFKHSNIILMCGGLGPTEDDLTKQSLAQWYGAPLVMHEPSLERVKYIFRNRPEFLIQRNFNQALVPEGAEALANPLGTAPGLFFRKNGQMLFAMPGVPHEMRLMMKEQVLPRIKEAYPPQHVFHRIVRLADIGESGAAEKVAPLLKNWPKDIQLAYLPRMDGLWLELSGAILPEKADQINALAEKWVQTFIATFPEHAYAQGDMAIEALLGETLREKGFSLAVAESLTGGNVAATIVSVSGASDYFKGSLTAYATEVKIQILKVPAALVAEHSVVSSQVVEAMAQGVKELFQCDIGLATTGLAEPSDTEPAQAWLGHADETGSRSRHLSLRFKRSTNITYTTKRLLLWCFQILNPKEGVMRT